MLLASAAIMEILYLPDVWEGLGCLCRPAKFAAAM